jgi:hypothetical protein
VNTYPLALKEDSISSPLDHLGATVPEAVELDGAGALYDAEEDFQAEADVLH